MKTKIFVLLLMMICSASASDWPMWRHDAARSAVAQDELPADLHLQWVRDLPSPKAAWPASQWKLQFDASYEPIVMNKTIYVPSMVRDSVTAYSTRTGEEKWRFYADGPVRFAPVAYNEALYFVSDDGYLYCLNAESGELIWRVRAGPSDRKIIGNDRVVSMWPARGAPVIRDGIIYFAGGIWPFMGTFIYALDAETGETIWCNSGSGSEYSMHQHGTWAFGGVAPQGYIAVSENKLLISGGRTVPAVYDRETGKFEYFHMANRKFGRDGGGYGVTVAGEYFINGGVMYRLDDGEGVIKVDDALCTSATRYFFPNNRHELAVGQLAPITKSSVDKTGKQTKKTVLETAWSASLTESVEKIFLQSGNSLFGSTKKKALFRIDLGDNSASITWKHDMETKPFSMLAADDRLFVVTENGQLHCFGKEIVKPKSFSILQKPLSEPKGDLIKSKAEGYCIALGCGQYVEEILTSSNLHVLLIENDKQKLDAFRRRMDAAGLYGRRISAIAGDFRSIDLSPYMANLLISENSFITGDNKQEIMKCFEWLRPYGGTAFLKTSGEKAALRLENEILDAKLKNAEVTREKDHVVLRRKGKLFGSSTWTHQYANTANTGISRDSLVKAPLGLLWFGGPPNDPVLPRHGHGPTPQVIGGRLFIEGRNLLRAVDVYTGRLLWERNLPNIGKYYDNTHHHPGANKIGSNYVSTEDGIYVVFPEICLLIDPATGKTHKEFLLPGETGEKKSHWGWITVWDDLLIATAKPLQIKEKGKKDERKFEINRNADYAAASEQLVVMNRYSGEVLWSRKADNNYRHNAIIAGTNMLFCIDGMSTKRLEAMKRCGMSLSETATLYAFEPETGKVVWQKTNDVFGTWLSYSKEYDILLQAGSAARDRAGDEYGGGMTAYRGKDGSLIWHTDINYKGPCLLWNKTIITQSGSYKDGFAVDLLTGEVRMRDNPVTGESEPWYYTRNYGCNTVIGSDHLLTFRSGAAGFVDMNADEGTANLGGFKSGCTSSLIPADGVLNAPDYTRTCTCSYQNQSSLALIHMPGVETWTISGGGKKEKKEKHTLSGEIKRIGINIGAPGDYMDDDETLWLDYPGIPGVSSDIKIYTEPDNLHEFRIHTSLVAGDGKKQIAASGVVGMRLMKISLSENPETARKYTVRLHFVESDRNPERRIFSVFLQGNKVITDLDVFKEAGGSLRPFVKEFAGIAVKDKLEIKLVPTEGDTVLSGVEIVAED